MTLKTIDLAADVGEVLLTEEAIQSKIAELGARISADYGDRRLTLVSVLKGSLPFMADLMRAISIPVRIDLMEVSSYGGTSTESSGLVRILKDLSASIEGEEVLIVEDIIDTGLTLNYLLRYLRGKNPRSLRVCTLLDKPARRLVDIPVDYLGFTIPDQFVVGYGLGLRRVLPEPPVRGRPAAPRSIRAAPEECIAAHWVAAGASPRSPR
jgi:hypoxanthine phosphoribosyltransferase